jgi:hypothetical protein
MIIIVTQANSLKKQKASAKIYYQFVSKYIEESTK